MSKYKDGGPAFPDGSQEDYTGGMSMRDYFAAKVASVVWNEIPSATSADEAAYFTANTAYKIADAMLKEREK